MFCWGAPLGLEYAIADGALLFRYSKKDCFYMPLGEQSARVAAISHLISLPDKFSFCGVSKDDVELLEQNFPDVFEITENTRTFDYIYESEKLQSLTGKKLASKRNHINAFISEGEWHVENITQKDIDALLAFNKKWCENYCEELNSSLEKEMCATELGLLNFDKLGYRGLMLYKNDVLVAYSFGEPLNHDTFCVHVEKADTAVRGAYQMINREFVRMYCDSFMYVNREDDAGDEGLRRAKLSYYPTDIGKKYQAVLKK